jgi:AraC family transcriptional regulator
MHANQDGSTLSGRAALNAAIVRLLDEAGSALDRDSHLARSFILRASALLRAERDEAPTPHSEVLRGGLAPWQAQRVIKHIDAAVGTKIRITDLAAITRLSASYFARAFKRSFGESPYCYILRRRLERAQEIMLTTDESLSQIALACGFSDQAHMTKLFRQIIGRSPGAWRRNLRGCPEERADPGRRQPSQAALALWPRAAA